MKTVLVISLVCLLAEATRAQAPAGGAAGQKHHHRAGATNDAAGASGVPGQPDPNAAMTAQVQEYQKTFVPTDPWRVINDATNYARGADWVQFEGQVTQVTDGGLILRGWYGEPLGYLVADKAGPENMMFVLSHYPRPVAVGQVLSRNDRLVALKSGAQDTLPNLDYGSVYVPVLTEDQKAQLASAKTKADSKVLAWHQELADKGDAYGEFKMGVRYEKGDGVTQDMQKARDLLTKSAAQGNSDAKDELAKLPAS